jgi:hypothetical protein
LLPCHLRRRKKQQHSPLAELRTPPTATALCPLASLRTPRLEEYSPLATLSALTATVAPVLLSHWLQNCRNSREFRHQQRYATNSNRKQ